MKIKKIESAVLMFFIFILFQEAGRYKTNDYFWIIQNDTICIPVECKMKIVDSFEGEAVLEISKMQNTKSEQYYEIKLKDFKGECEIHGNVHTTECEYTDAIKMGYFYVDEENIYMIPLSKQNFEIISNSDTFPPTSNFLEQWVQNRGEINQVNKCFTYRLVCSKNGFEDTFYLGRDEANLDDGKIYDQRYHNRIEIEEDMAKYVLYPDEMGGTDEYTYITWVKGKGIVNYTSWRGNYNGLISFWVEPFSSISHYERMMIK